VLRAAEKAAARGAQTPADEPETVPA
jgi:hypothetical protein